MYSTTPVHFKPALHFLFHLQIGLHCDNVLCCTDIHFSSARNIEWIISWLIEYSVRLLCTANWVCSDNCCYQDDLPTCAAVAAEQFAATVSSVSLMPPTHDDTPSQNNCRPHVKWQYKAEQKRHYFFYNVYVHTTRKLTETWDQGGMYVAEIQE